MFLPCVRRSGSTLHREIALQTSRTITPAVASWHCRGYAVAKGERERASISDSKPKPKATTTLRRSASASLPIRVNPTPTRSDIQPVFTFATAERYLLSRLRVHPDLPAQSQTLHESWWVPKWAGKAGREGEIFVFSNGSYVCWGLGEEDALAFKEQVIDKTPGLQVAPLREIEDEELEFVVDPTECEHLLNPVPFLTFYL